MDINVKNISALINFMEGLNDPRFDMREFVHDCGSPSCAIGWAKTMPEFADVWKRDPYYGDFASSVFGFDSYWELFNGRRHFGKIKTPQQWAAHAREFLRERGHEVLPHTQEQRDDFKKFMERTMKPVKVTNPIEA